MRGIQETIFTFTEGSGYVNTIAPGCVIDCRLLGAIRAEQLAKPGQSKLIRNDRFLAVPGCSNIFSKIESIGDLPKKTLKELQQFFIGNNKQEEKEFKLLELIGPKEAAKVIKSGETDKRSVFYTKTFFNLPSP